MRITFLTNYNLYESKRYFSENFATSLRSLDIDVNLIDLHTIQKQEDEFKRACDPSETDFTCSFNSMIPNNDGHFLADITGVPHIAFIVDPAFNYLEMYKSPNTVFTFVDHLDKKFADQYGASKNFFLAHAIEKELQKDPKTEKIYDVVLLGSCYDHETLRDHWRIMMKKNEVDAIEEAVSIILADNKTPIHTAIYDSLKKNKIIKDEDTTDEILNKIRFYGNFADYYARGYDRTSLIKSIKGHTVHVFGDKCWRDAPPVLDWRHSLQGMDNVVIHPAVEFADSLEILKKSKICLNSMPFFKNGSHERIFTSLACQALPVTTDNLWIKNNFVDKEDLLIYRSHHYDQAAEAVNFYLNNPNKLQEACQRGREKVMQNHTWDNRAKELLTIISSIK